MIYNMVQFFFSFSHFPFKGIPSSLPPKMKGKMVTTTNEHGKATLLEI